MVGTGDSTGDNGHKLKYRNSTFIYIFFFTVGVMELKNRLLREVVEYSP